MHFDASPCIDVDAITLFVIFTDKEEYIGGTCRGSVTVTDNPLDIVARWDKESRPCFQGFISSLDDGQEVSEALTEFFFCANLIPAVEDLAALREADFECNQDRV